MAPPTAPKPAKKTPPTPPTGALQAAAKRWAGLEPTERRGLLEALGNSVCDTPKQSSQLRFDELVDHVRAALATQ